MRILWELEWWIRTHRFARLIWSQMLDYIMWARLAPKISEHATWDCTPTERKINSYTQSTVSLSQQRLEVLKSEDRNIWSALINWWMTDEFYSAWRQIRGGPPSRLWCMIMQRRFVPCYAELTDVVKQVPVLIPMESFSLL